VSAPSVIASYRIGTSGAFTPITMSLNSGTSVSGTYRTSSPIPAQLGGTIVQYYVSAEDIDGHATRQPLTEGTYLSYSVSGAVFFSEYVEGSSNNKAVEIFNNTDAAIDLGGEGYKVEIYFNGATTPLNTINLSGTIQPKSETQTGNFVLTHSSAVPSLLAVANQVSASLTFNGNDAVVLKRGSVVVDCIGRVGEDPGSGWISDDTVPATKTVDNTLVRKPHIATGDTITTDAFNPATEWIGYPVDTFTHLGDHYVPVTVSGFAVE
jgi:predicted extracellular nuclease